MSLNISQRNGARLAEEARRQGITVDALWSGSSTSARPMSTRGAGRLLNCRSGDLA